MACLEAMDQKKLDWTDSVVLDAFQGSNHHQSVVVENIPISDTVRSSSHLVSTAM